MESFIFFGLFVFFLHMYNINTKSLIIVGAHLMKIKNKTKQEQKILCTIRFLD